MVMRFANRRSAIAAATMALIGSFFPQEAPAQAAQRIALERFVVVHGSSMKVSDLLPPQAPPALRTSAQEISLGDAPLPGTHRTFNRAQIARVLAPAPDLRNLLDIPASIDVTRWSRKLTREEVLAAIVETADATRLLAAGDLRAEDLTFASAVTVTEQAPKIEVTRIESLRNGTGTRVRLWTPSEPRLPPFSVALDREIAQSPSAPGAENVALRRHDGRDEAQQAITPAPPSATDARTARIQPVMFSPSSRHAPDTDPIVVKVGQLVRLVAQRTGMRITTSAISIDPGRAGEKIRVHSDLNGKTLVATVIDARTVQIDY
jgi:Chaperone for flagella basal body P-ring formation